jgi:hypothetical protein
VKTGPQENVDFYRSEQRRLTLPRIEEARTQLAQAIKTHSARTTVLRKAKLMDTFVEVAAAIQRAHLGFIDAHNEPELVRIDTKTQRLSDEHALTGVTLNPLTGLPTEVTKSLVLAETEIVAAPLTLERSCELWRFGFEGRATT